MHVKTISVSVRGGRASLVMPIGDPWDGVFNPLLTLTGLLLRVRNENLIYLFLNQNICCGYSKEPYE